MFQMLWAAAAMEHPGNELLKFEEHSFGAFDRKKYLEAAEARVELS